MKIFEAIYLTFIIFFAFLIPSTTAQNPVLISISNGIAPPYYGQGPYSNMCRMGAGTGFQFHDRTSTASPKIEHCLALAGYFRLTDNEIFHMHDWGLGIYHRLWPNDKIPGVLSKGQMKDMANRCVFGIRFPAAMDKVVMSGKDVADLIELSVSAAGRDGRVGSEGTLKCMSLKPIQEVNRWVDVEFGVFARETEKRWWEYRN